jgi:methionyl-tRNA formyltransferase
MRWRHQGIASGVAFDRPAGRGRPLRASAVKQGALELALPVAQPARLASAAERAQLEAWRPELLVVVAYGLLLPGAVLELPRLGCLNLHASLLPRWRGAAPIQRALLAGDTVSGVTIMQLDAGLIRALSRRSRRRLRRHDQRGAARTARTWLAAVARSAGAQRRRAQPRAQPDEGVSFAPGSRSARRRSTGRRCRTDARQVRLQPAPVAQTQLAMCSCAFKARAQHQPPGAP